MDISSGRVFIVRDVKFDEFTLYHQLLKTKPTKRAFEPAEQDMDSEIEDLPKVMIQSVKAKVQPPKAAALPRALPRVLPRAINPFDDSDDDLTPLPEEPPPEISPPKPRRSERTAANVSIAMMIEQGPKTYGAALDAEDAEQWKEAIVKEMASMESHEVFTFIEKVPEGASMIGICWVMGRKLMANGTIDKWKVQLVGRGDLLKPGDYNDITSPVIDWASIWLALGLAAKHDLEIAVLDIPTAFLTCPLHETLYMCLPEGEWPHPCGRTRPLVKLIKQANREDYEEVFDYIVDDLGLQASIAALGLFFSGNLGEANGILIPIFIDDIIIIGSLVLVASISSWLYAQFKAAGHVPVPDTFQYLSMTVTRDRSKRSITIDQIRYINWVLDRFEMTDCRKRSTPMEIGYKPHMIHPELGEQPFDARTYQKAIGSILYATLGTRPDITYATSVLRRYAAQPSTRHWEAVKHLLQYLRGTSEYKLKIYDPSLGHDSQSISCYADADLGGEADTSKSTSEIVVYALGTLVIWKSKKQSVVAQSTMHAEMIATAYGKVHIDWLRDLTSEIAIASKDIFRLILNDGLNCVITLNSGNFQSDSRHLQLRYHSIDQVIAKGEVEIKHVAGTEMLADDPTKALGGVKLSEFGEEIGLG